MNKRLLIVFAIIGIGVIALMQILNHEKPRSILSFSNCELPCWNNITPGVTTILNAKKIMESEQFVRESDFFEYEQTIIFFVPLDDLGIYEANGSISSNENKVTTISIAGRTLGSTVDEIFENIGSPQYIISTYFGGGGITFFCLLS